jgi:gamma-glutamyltranspeptidase/glutathione hydrolase
MICFSQILRAAALLLAVPVIALSAAGSTRAQVPELLQPAPESTTSGSAVADLAIAGEYMVVAANPLAAEAGAQVLVEGGTAVDAMIASQLVLNLVEPQNSGIGGGAFLIHYDAKSRRISTFDGRETAPREATPGLFLDAEGKPLTFMDAVVGGRSVGTPGTLRLLELAHRLHGNLPWPRLFEPAIRLAEQGFTVSPRLAARVAEDAERLRRYPATRAYFFGPDHAPIQAGGTQRNTQLAATLRTIAEQGADAFYSGEIARDIVDTVRHAEGNPGTLSLEDLADYRVVLRDPVCAPYRGYDVCGMGPPSSGALAIGQILGILEHFDVRSLAPGSVEAVHLFAEASKLAYADRALYMADADFVRVPARGLLDSAYLTARAQLVNRERAGPKAAAGNPPWRDATLYAPDESLEIPSTSHLSIVDRDGNVVALTTTIEAGFGSRLMVRGFLLNNELTDFSFAPADERGRPVANRVEPGKRPRSSMAPTIVLDKGGGDPILVIGSPGGSRIIPYVAKTIVGVLDWDLDPQQAIALPHFANLNGPTELEAGTPMANLKPALEALGHEVRVTEMNSGLHGIAIKQGRLVGGVDPRREGRALGQ